MGRRNTGGNRAKKQARKHVNTTEHKAKLRTIFDEDEQYARVIKINGGGTADVLCNDGIKRLLIIRKKFKGRNKRDNQIKLNSVVLIGLRSWEVVGSSKKPKVDLLYIYSSNQLFELSKLSTINQTILPDEYQTKTTDTDPYKTGNAMSMDTTDCLHKTTYSDENTKITLDDGMNWDDI